MPTLLIATHNLGKLKEIQHVLRNQAIELKSLADFNIPEVTETGFTFVENALIKARHASTYVDMPIIADDSGLVVPALRGEPGIYSSRYAGIQGSDKKNIQKLLTNLQNVPETARNAYFHCTIVVLRHKLDPEPIICQSNWQGKILFEPRGHEGFGYDPIFYDFHHQKAAAELSIKEKNSVSHRGKALQCLQNKLGYLFNLG